MYSLLSALIVGGGSLSQLWLFWLAPLIGAAVAGLSNKLITDVSVPSASLSAPESSC